MDLRHLTDKALLLETKALVSKEREVSTKILHHLKEIDKRKLYCDLGFPSLFDYCLKELGYASSSAHRRIQSARLLAELPEIETKIEDGSLTMTNASLLTPFLRENNITEPEEKLKVIRRIENLTARGCEKELFIISGKDESELKDKQRRISADKIRITLTLSDETSEILDEVKNLLPKNLVLDDLIRRIAIIARDQLRKEKFKLHRPKYSLPALGVTRVIANSVKREVYNRDQECTQCGTKHRLQYDHRYPFAFGGDSSVKNVRLLCFQCNQRARIKARL